MWLFQKEKDRQAVISKSRNGKPEASVTDLRSEQSWFGSKPDKAFLLNRYEGHAWSQFYLRCSFLDEHSFCSSSEDGFLCVWDLNQSTPIQKQKVSNFVLNDVAVERIEEHEEEEGQVAEDKEGSKGERMSENGQSKRTSKKKVVIAVGSDDCLVRVL